MTSSEVFGHCLCRILLSTVACLVAPAAGFSQDVLDPAQAQSDPTEPSQMLAELLQSPAVRAALPVEELPPAHSPPAAFDAAQLRLRGLVLRDAAHGTALISAGGSRLYMVELRRAEASAEPQLLNVGGALFTVESFSGSGIVLRNTETGQKIPVN